MKKLVALEKIKGLMSGTTYAEKYDEIELTIERFGVSQYMNRRTGLLFDARNDRIGMVDEFDIAAHIPQKENKRSNDKINRVIKDNKQQGTLF